MRSRTSEDANVHRGHQRLGRADCGEGVREMITTQLPDRRDIQLLRSFAHPRLKLAGDVYQRLPGLADAGMQAG